MATIGRFSPRPQDASMHAATREWLDGLRDFAATKRLECPLAAAGRPAEQAAERMILAAQLSTWLAGSETIMAARGDWLSGGRSGDPDPVVVITTSAVGINVAEEQLTSRSLPARAIADRAVAVTELEYRLWCIRHPDDQHARHINIWNWIKTSVPLKRHTEFSRHPLAAGESYWLHRAGIAGAGGADRRDCHLWKWNGRHAALLEACVTERGVAELK